MNEMHIAFHWSSSIGKPRMTPVSVVKTTNHTRFADESYEVCRLGHHLGIVHFYRNEPTRVPNYRIGPVCAGVHSCNSWLTSNIAKRAITNTQRRIVWIENIKTVLLFLNTCMT